MSAGTSFSLIQQEDSGRQAVIFSDLDAFLAKGIAEGDICPVTREALDDISPWYVPKKVKRSESKTALGDVTNKRQPSTGPSNTMGVLTSYFSEFPSFLGSSRSSLNMPSPVIFLFVLILV